MPYDDILLETEERMDKSLVFLHDEYTRVRSGRATPGLVENIKIEYYGTETPLKQLAAIGAPEARLLVIRPFDPGSIQAIEKSILKSDVGITPSSNGKLIRLVVPPLSEERRIQLVAQTKHMAEEAKVAIRNERRDAIKAAEKEKKDGAMTEDEFEQFKEDVQEITSEYTDKADKLHAAKSEELMQV